MRHKIAFALLAAVPLVAQVRVVASNGVKAALQELRPQCESAAAQPLRIEYATSAATVEHIQSGEAFDIAILTSEVVDALTKAGKLSPSSRANLGRSGIGVGFRKGAKKPDVSTAAAFKNALLTAKAITYAQDGASRATLEKSFGQMGIADAMKKKTLLEQGSTRATADVASGKADLVLTLVSEILPAPGVDLAGPIPADFQTYVAFSAALNAQAGNSPAALAVLKFLSGPAVGPVLRSKGMEPTAAP